MIGRCRWLVLPLVALHCACATPGVVRLDTARSAPVVYTPPPDARTVEMAQREFVEMVSVLALNTRLPLELAGAFGESPVAWRGTEDTGWGLVRVGFFTDRDDGLQAGPASRVTLSGAAEHLTLRERQDFALSCALDRVWVGVAEAVRATVDPQALKAMVASALCTYMLLVVAPEPVTKFIAIALTAYLIAYVGCVPLWNMVDAYRLLRESCRQATTLHQLEKAGNRFGEVMGDNGARVLIMVALAAAGGRAGMSLKGPALPGYARAALASETNVGLRLAAVAEGGVQSISVRPGTLAVGVTPSAVASTAWGAGQGGGPRRKGSLTGRPRRLEPNDKKPENIRAAQRENESARTLADNGYDVEQNPPGAPSNNKKPDYRINGEYSDCYAPSTDVPRNVWKTIQNKITTDQAPNIILNLDDSTLELGAMQKQLHDWPIPGLKRVIAIRGESITHIYP